MTPVDIKLLARFEPTAMLSAGRLKELAGLCFVEKVNKDIDPLRMNVVKSAQAIYLIKGDLGIRFIDGTKKILRGGTEAATHSIDASHPKLQDTIAITPIEIVRIDLDLLDIMMTWDQLSGNNDLAKTERNQSAAAKVSANEKKAGAITGMKYSSMLSANSLQNGAFSRVPPANIEEMLKRMVSVPVKAGQVIITQGAEGDYYYLIEKGVAIVSRVLEPGEPAVVLAELKERDAFGEEALVSDNKRNATITMKTDGHLLRLNKTDFVELLKAPLINHISRSEAEEKIKAGAVWLDVRFPSEFAFDHLPNAVNTPLNQIRSAVTSLDKTKSYIVYCQTGRRSSAAAFILIQHGFEVWVLKGGTRSIV